MPEPIRPEPLSEDRELDPAASDHLLEEGRRSSRTSSSGFWSKSPSGFVSVPTGATIDDAAEQAGHAVYAEPPRPSRLLVAAGMAVVALCWALFLGLAGWLLFEHVAATSPATESGTTLARAQLPAGALPKRLSSPLPSSLLPPPDPPHVCERRTTLGTSMSSSERLVHGALSQAARAPSVVKSRVGSKCSRDQKSRERRISDTKRAACDASDGGSAGLRRRASASGAASPSLLSSEFGSTVVNPRRSNSDRSLLAAGCARSAAPLRSGFSCRVAYHSSSFAMSTRS